MTKDLTHKSYREYLHKETGESVMFEQLVEVDPRGGEGGGGLLDRSVTGRSIDG